MRKIMASSVVVALVMAAAAARAEAQGTGLRGDYYDNQDFTGATANRTEGPIDYNWTSATPTPLPAALTGGATSFSVRWTGCVQTTAAAGLYTFTARTDDGVRLWVNGQLIVDWWQGQGATDRSGTITLAANTKYDIRMDYYQGGGDASTQLRWTPFGGTDAVIPQANLYDQVAPPVIEPAGGALSDSVIVYITEATQGATIYYSVDGVDPVVGNANTFQYTGPIAVSATTTVKAIGVKTGLTTSDVVAATYTISDTTAPTLVDAIPSGPNTVRVRFSEAVQPASAQTGTNYTITPGMTVSGAALLTNPPNTATVTLSTNLVAGTLYTVTVSNVQDLNGNTIVGGSQVTFTYIPLGLFATYRDNWDFTGATFQRVDPVVNFSWAALSPDGSIGVDLFSARWVGRIKPEFTETYTIHFTSDDGARLWVDGQIRIDQWVNRGATTNSFTIAMTAGNTYLIRLEYYENTGDASAVLEWESPHQVREVIPTHRLLLRAAPPTISPTGGTFTDGVAVTLTPPYPGLTMRYTTDGSIPSATAGTVYAGPFALNANATVRAVAYNTSLVESEVTVSSAFTITDAAAPTIAWVRASRPTRVLVRFNEPVAAAGANTAGNYVIDGGNVAVSSAVLGMDLQTVVLTTAALVPGQNYGIVVSNITDTAAAPHTIVANTTTGFNYPVPLASAISRWAFDEGSGTAVADTLGTNNGVTENTPPWTLSPVGFGMAFDGSEQFVDLAADLAPTLGVTSSLSFWIKTTQPASSLRPGDFWFAPGVTGVEDANGGNDVFWGILNGTGQIGGRAGDVATIQSVNPVIDGAWHHVVITWDSVLATNNMVVYVDGAQVATGTTGTGPKTSPFDSLARVMKVTNPALTPASPPNYYGGELSDVRAFNAVLTATQVATLFNQPPTVVAGPDVTVGVGQAANLNGGSITDDNLPTNTLTQTWSLVTGPVGGNVVFGTPNALTTTATFSAAGTYVVRLTGSDGSLTSSDELTVTVSGIVITPITGLTTTEAGGTATFDVVLSTVPTDTVTVTFQSSNPAEGTVPATPLTFTVGNWNVPQTVTITGVDDAVYDPGTVYTIVSNPATSNDLNYAGVNPADVTVTNTSDDALPEPDAVWDGCGATGAEVVLGFLLLGLWRRRSRR